MNFFKKILTATLLVVSLGGMAAGLAACGDKENTTPPKTYDLYERSHFTWDETNKIITGLSDEGKEVADSKRFITLSIPEGTEAVSYKGAPMAGPFEYCTITITDEERETYTWAAHNEPVNKITEVNLPSSLKVLDDNAFYNFVLVTKIDLPEGLQKISDTALGEVCFQEITIPSTVTEMGDCFYGCRELKRIKFAQGFHMSELPDSFAAHSQKLEEVIIPEGVTSIGYCAFDGCTALTNVVLPTGLTNIGYLAFSQCNSLTTITLPATITDLGNSMGGPFVSDHFVSGNTTDGKECRFTSIVCETEELYNRIVNDSSHEHFHLTTEELAKLTYPGKAD